MHDVTIRLPHRPGALAEMGEALGRAGVSVEGGGGWVTDGSAIMHFLFEDGNAARAALEGSGIEVLDVRDVLVQKLDQETPGQLGKIGRAMAEAGVNIEVVYSDHANQLVLGVDDAVAGRRVSEAWTAAQSAKPRGREHHYDVSLQWTGNTGTGTATYQGYSRDHELTADSHPAIPGTADPHFRGDASRWNPEELLVASLSACHKLSYLALAARARIVVTSYEDRAQGVMEETANGGGRFTGVVLHPLVTITDASKVPDAIALHAQAHHLCFIANSVNFTVACDPTVHVGGD